MEEENLPGPQGTFSLDSQMVQRQRLDCLRIGNLGRKDVTQNAFSAGHQ
jgi:hypothetical protein